jgi:hypothetical protein
MNGWISICHGCAQKAMILEEWQSAMKESLGGECQLCGSITHLKEILRVHLSLKDKPSGGGDKQRLP